MTSQIVMMNGFGVALASDSAVTLGQSRTYDTAEKVVPLPMPHRIAVLHAGAVRLGNLPYSVFVGEWIRQLGPKPLRSAEAYQRSFQDWLSNNPQWFSEDAESAEVMRFINQRAEALSRAFHHHRGNDENFSFATLLADWTEEVAGTRRLEGASPELAKDSFSKFTEEIDEVFNEKIVPLSDAPTLKEDFLSYCAVYFSSDWMTNSVLTFVGYGESEIFASYTTIEFHGFINRSLRWVTGSSFALTPATDPLFAIHLPAQSDAIDSYLRGYDFNMIDSLVDHATSERFEILNRIREKYSKSEEDLQKLDQAVESVLEEFESRLWNRVHEFSEERYVDGLRTAIAALPPASLVDVARSLIELQALRKTTTAQQGTVGGPIDVALITPVDGFTWIRHKSIT